MTSRNHYKRTKNTMSNLSEKVEVLEVFNRELGIQNANLKGENAALADQVADMMRQRNLAIRAMEALLSGDSIDEATEDALKREGLLREPLDPARLVNLL